MPVVDQERLFHKRNRIRATSERTRLRSRSASRAHRRSCTTCSGSRVLSLPCYVRLESLGASGLLRFLFMPRRHDLVIYLHIYHLRRCAKLCRACRIQRNRSCWKVLQWPSRVRITLARSRVQHVELGILLLSRKTLASASSCNV